MASPEARGSKQGKLKLGPALREDIVIVEVGAEKKKYFLHRAVLVHHSEYFRNALRGPWKEAQDGVVPLADIEVEIFDVFAHWIYSTKLPDDMCTTPEMIQDARRSKGGEKLVTNILWRHLRAFVCGDRLLAHHFRCAVHENMNDALSGIQVWNNGDHQCIDSVVYAYENIPSHYPILQQLADLYREDWCIFGKLRRCFGMSDWEKKISVPFTVAAQKSLPVDLLLRVMQGIQQHGQDYDCKWNEKHCYLEHEWHIDQKPCQKLHVSYDEMTGYGFDEQVNDKTVKKNTKKTTSATKEIENRS